MDYLGFNFNRNQIAFSVFSQQEAKKLSLLELFERNLYDLTKANRPPARFGVLDRRLVMLSYDHSHFTRAY
jgi:DNA-directed RNA polymerase III subunit RPC1